MRIRWLGVLIVAAGLLALLLFGRDPEEERAGPDPVVPERVPPEPDSVPDGPGLRPYGFRILVAPGVEAPSSLAVHFDQPLLDYTTTRRLVPDRAADVRLHPTKTRITLRGGGDGLTLSPGRYDLPDRPDATPIDLLLSAAGDLSLLLKDGKTDEPIRGFKMTVSGRNGLLVEEGAVSDDSGHAVFPGLPTGTYGLDIGQFDRTADPTGTRLQGPETIVKVRAGEVAKERILLYPFGKPEYTVRVEMTVDGRPPPPDLEYRLIVDWRGVGWMLKREAPGKSVGRRKHRLGMSTTDEGGVVRVLGHGVKDFVYEFPPGLATGNHLVLRIDVEGHHGEARGILVDEQGGPIADRTFRLRISPDGNTRSHLREVTTNEVGEFTLPYVSFPILYQAVNDTPGERLVPSDVRSGQAQEGEVIRIVRYSRNDVRLAIEDPELFAEMIDASDSQAILEVTPLTGGSARIRETWKTVDRLDIEAVMAAREHGAFSLGDLPAGDYFLWMVIPTGGAWNAEIHVAGGTRKEKFTVSVKPSHEALEGRLLRDGAPVEDALVIDGYVPHYLCYSLPESARSLGRHANEIRERCLDYSDGEGAFRIPVHNSDNPWLSVIPGEGTVYHVKKTDLSGRQDWELEDHPGDVLVRGRVVDEEGKGLPGLRVALAPLGGADDRVAMQTPDPRHIHPEVTGEDGAFTVRGVRPGSYLLAVCVTMVSGPVENNVFLHESTRIVDVRKLPRDGLVVTVDESQRSFLERAKAALENSKEDDGHDHR